MTDHPDPIDKAAALTDMYTEHCVAAARQGAKPEQVQNEDGSWPVTECIDCGVDLPQARIELGRVRCVECQHRLEQRNRLLYGR